MQPLYVAVRLTARFWIWFFFKAVDARHPERVPRQGPVLLCVNHPNNLIDSLLMGAVLPRQVHFLATAALFRRRLLARFLAAVGMIPIYRRQDDPEKMEQNVASFEACFRAFEQGRLIVIYPEGTTHAEPRVQRIKTGAARIALEAEARRDGKLGLALIPVGLTFEALYRDDLARELREERGISPRQIDIFQLSRAIVAAVHYFKEHDPDRVGRIWQRIQTYKALLAEYRARDQAVRDRYETAPPRARLARSGLGLLGLPIFAYGALVNALPYYLPRWLARTLTSKETDYATARLLSSIILIPLFWGLETWVVWRLTGPRIAALFLFSLPLSGLLAYRYLGGLARLRSRLGFARLAMTRNHAAARLLAERQQILAELDQAKRDYLPATAGSSF